jgi:ankyrin repeat protein
VAAWLLDHGADIDARDIDHESTPAQHAVRHRPAVARLLLDRGAIEDPFLLAGCGAAERLAAWLDRHPEDLRARLTRQRFDAPGSTAEHIYCYLLGFDATLLHVAARCDQPETVRLLVDRGLDVNVRGEYDQATPLHLAAWDGCVRAAEALIGVGADLNLRSGRIHNNEPVGWAGVAGRPDIVALLIERGALVRPAHLANARDGAAGKFNYTGAPATAFAECARSLERALAAG